MSFDDLQITAERIPLGCSVSAAGATGGSFGPPVSYRFHHGHDRAVEAHWQAKRQPVAPDRDGRAF